MFALLFIALQFSHATMSLLTDGEILPADKWRGGLSLQGVLNGNDGINMAGHFDIGINDSTEVLLEAGTGATDFFGSLKFKYVPFPDYQRQPAIGFILGTTVLSEGGDSTTFINLKTLASKRFDTDFGPMTPYAALSLNLALSKSYKEDPLHLIVGGKYAPPDWPNTFIHAEIGLDVADAFNYIAGYVTYEFDSPRETFASPR